MIMRMPHSERYRDENENRQKMDQAEGSEHPDFVDPEATGGDKWHDRRPDVADCSMARGSLREHQLRPAENEGSERCQGMPAYRETFGE
jgi:hypothetical protein